MNISSRWLSSLLALLIVGCNWADGLRRAASVEHGCPQENIHVVADDGDNMARTVQLDVCGSRRIYRDMGGRQAVVWVDVTTPTGGGETPATVAAPVQEIAAPAPVDPAQFPGLVRARIDAHAGRVLACAGAESGAIEATWSESGAVALSLRGEVDPAIAECVSASIGSIEVPAGAAPGHLIHPVTR